MPSRTHTSKEARCDGQIQVLDSEFNPVATYAFERGWVSKYTPAAMNAGQDQSAIEEITIIAAYSARKNSEKRKPLYSV